MALFLLVRAINRLQTEPPAKPEAAPPPPEDVLLLREIRDSLKGRG
jgi:large conductance mechanosensitive channel